MPSGTAISRCSREQRCQKFLDCAAHSATLLRRAALEAVMDRIDGLEDVPDVRGARGAAERPELIGWWRRLKPS